MPFIALADSLAHGTASSVVRSPHASVQRAAGSVISWIQLCFYPPVS